MNDIEKLIVVIDPKMPADQAELRGSNGQVVRIVNIGGEEKTKGS